MKQVIKRIISKDIKSIQEKKINDLGIYIEFNESNFLRAQAMIIGPKDSLYYNGILLFDIEFPSNYPFTPPSIKYIKSNNIRIHPNFYVNGKVCLSILGTWSGPGWSSIMDISDVFITLQSLLDMNPIQHEPGYENIVNSNTKLYNQLIEYNTINSLIIDRYVYFKEQQSDFPYFFNIIKTHIFKYHEELLKMIEKKHKKKLIVKIGIYNIYSIIDYEQLIQKYLKIFNII